MLPVFQACYRIESFLKTAGKVMNSTLVTSTGRNALPIIGT